MKAKTVSLLFLILGTLFSALYVLLAFNNRLPYEDYHFTSLSKDQGAVNAMLYIYKVYSARWSAHTLGFLFSAFYGSRYFLFLFNLITLAAFLLSAFLLLKKALNEILEFDLSQTTLYTCTMLLTVCFFFASYDIGEVWFWYMVSWMYMWSIIAGNILTWLLLSKRTGLKDIPLIILLTAYIAGAGESYAMIYLLFLFTLILLKKQNKLQALSSQTAMQTLLFATLSLLLFYMITLAAPGTWARKERLTDASVMMHVIMTMKAYGIVLLLKTPKLLPYLLLFGIPWMIPGSHNSSKEKIEFKKIIPALLKSMVALGIMIFLLMLPASWILYDVPPARALSQVSLLLAIYASGLFFYIGHKVRLPEKTIHRISVIALVAGALVVSFHLTEQYSVTGNYTREYDQRLTDIVTESNAGRKHTLVLEPHSPSGMIYSDEMDTDSLSNHFFEKLASPDFHVAIRK